MRRLFNIYINTFRGLSKEVWWLALITLINRAGTMVVPFLSLYLKESLHFTLSDVGWIMTAFGLGSVSGSWLGGKLTDRIGYYKVMLYSLLITGILFIGLQFLDTFLALCIGVFVVTVSGDSFRPAIFVALNAYSKPENKVRSVTLIRLAINLGFSAGPAVGGIIIMGLGYGGLFWVDGLTCIIASIVLLKVLHPKKARELDIVKNENPISVFSDKVFMVFLIGMMLFGVVFLQYFSTIPIYYKSVHILTELQIGLLMGMNGLLIFIFEMPLIKWLENSAYTKLKLMYFGAILTGLSFLVINFTAWSGVLVIGMILMTFGEMIVFPFSNAFAIDRGKKGKQGEFMAMYAISFSIAHIFGHNAGLQLTSHLGFDMTWYLITAVAAICALLIFGLNKHLTLSKK